MSEISDNQKPGAALKIFLSDPNVRFPCWPRLSRDIAQCQMPNDIGVQFRGGPSEVLIEGPKVVEIVRYLNANMTGEKDLDGILAGAPRALPEIGILQVLASLHKKGLLREGRTDAGVLADSGRDSQQLFWSRNLGVTGYLHHEDDVLEALRRTRLMVFGSGLLASITCELLVNVGFSDLIVVDWDDDGSFLRRVNALPITPRTTIHIPTTSVETAVRHIGSHVKDVDVLICATRHAPKLLFRLINRLCLENERRVIFANDNGSSYSIGPTVFPYASACFYCSELRNLSAGDDMLADQVFEASLLEERTAGETAPRGEGWGEATQVASYVSLEAMRIASGLALPQMINSILEAAPLIGRLESHKIMRVPRCPECNKGSRFQIAPSVDV